MGYLWGLRFGGLGFGGLGFRGLGVWGLELFFDFRVVCFCKGSHIQSSLIIWGVIGIWEFPKIGDPNLAP